MASNGDRLVGKFTERALMKRAEEVVTEKSKSSEIFDAEAEKMLPRFNRSGEFHISAWRFVLPKIFGVRHIMLKNFYSPREFKHVAPPPLPRRTFSYDTAQSSSWAKSSARADSAS
jgi:hypothetical protein